MKENKLGEITKIRSGYSFRRKIEQQEGGNIYVVTGGDIGDDFYLQEENLIKIIKEVGEDKLIQKGDVLLTVRGKFKAVVSNNQGSLIATSSVCSLRVNRDIVLPEYIALWLNSKVGQTEINRNVTGATIKIILKKDLENIKIKIPNLEIQHEIVEFYKNTKELKNKLKTKTEMVENIFQGALTEIINNKN